jgi:hypothetical protein
MKSARIARLRLLIMRGQYEPPSREVVISMKDKVDLYVAKIRRTEHRTRAQDRLIRRYFDAAGREV